VKIGTKINGNPKPRSMREMAKDQKSKSLQILVKSYIDSAMITAPAEIIYLG